MFLTDRTIPVIVQGDSVKERVKAADEDKRGKKRLKKGHGHSSPPRKKIAKVEATTPVVKVPDYANMQEADDETARVRTKLGIH